MNCNRKFAALFMALLAAASTLLLSGCGGNIDICMDQRFELQDMFAQTCRTVYDYPESERLHIYSLYEAAWERTDGSDPKEYFRDVPGELAVSLSDIPSAAELRPDLTLSVTEEKLSALGAWLNVSASDVGADFMLYGLDLDIYSGEPIGNYFQKTTVTAPLLRLEDTATGSTTYLRLTDFTAEGERETRCLVYRMNESTVRNQLGCSPRFLYDKLTNDESETGCYNASLLFSWMDREMNTVETVLPIYGVNEYISPEEQYADLIGELTAYNGGIGTDNFLGAFFARFGRAVAGFFVAIYRLVRDLVIR